MQNIKEQELIIVYVQNYALKIWKDKGLTNSSQRNFDSVYSHQLRARRALFIFNDVPSFRTKRVQAIASYKMYGDKTPFCVFQWNMLLNSINALLVLQPTFYLRNAANGFILN